MPKRNGYYGWRADRPDFRDLRATPPAPSAILPSAVDLRSGFPDCYDQGDLGSCTANAIAGALEFDQRKQKQKKLFTPSRLFIYYNERDMEGDIGEDAGAEIRDGIKSVNVLGAPPETAWKYDINKFAKKPTKSAYTQAKAHQALRYERLTGTNINALRACLAGGFPFVFGFSCYESFESDSVAKSGILDLPTKNEKQTGGHAVCCVGYDDMAERVMIRNSWGKDWGMTGYFTMPYAYITNGDLADDFWTIAQIE